MDTITPAEFQQVLRNHYILLDTNVFIDASAAPIEYGKFFVTLRAAENTLVTINSVKLEFVRGSADSERFKVKSNYLGEVVDAILPITPEIHKNALELAERYKAEGKGVSTVDYLLAGTLMQYKKNICLMTRDIKDFPSSIFKLITLVNIYRDRHIFTYGFFSYQK